MNLIFFLHLVFPELELSKLYKIEYISDSHHHHHCLILHHCLCHRRRLLCHRSCRGLCHYHCLGMNLIIMLHLLLPELELAMLNKIVHIICSVRSSLTLVVANIIVVFFLYTVIVAVLE